MLTKEQRIEIASLSGEGWNVSEIAKKMNLAGKRSSVAYCNTQ